MSITAVSSGRAYTTATAAVGARLFIDRTYVVTTLPAELDGGLMVQAANDDKAVTANPHLTIQLSGAATVYVAYDSRGTSVPAWLNGGGYTLTSLSMVTTDGIGSLSRRVYRRDVAAGAVSFGGNLQAPAAGAGTTYTVIAVPR